MTNAKISDLNNSQLKPYKQLWKFGDIPLIAIDKSIIEKLGITENSIVFLEQELTSDNIILMKIKKF